MGKVKDWLSNPANKAFLGAFGQYLSQASMSDAPLAYVGSAFGAGGDARNAFLEKQKEEDERRRKELEAQYRRNEARLDDLHQQSDAIDERRTGNQEQQMRMNAIEGMTDDPAAQQLLMLSAGNESQFLNIARTLKAQGDAEADDNYARAKEIQAESEAEDQAAAILASLPPELREQLAGLEMSPEQLRALAVNEVSAERGSSRRLGQLEQELQLRDQYRNDQEIEGISAGMAREMRIKLDNYEKTLGPAYETPEYENPAEAEQRAAEAGLLTERQRDQKIAEYSQQLLQEATGGPVSIPLNAPTTPEEAVAATGATAASSAELQTVLPSLPPALQDEVKADIANGVPIEEILADLRELTGQ